MRAMLSHRRACGALCAAVASLTLLAALPSPASAQTAADKKKRDQDVQRYVKQLSARFTAWDTNSNGTLDKQELAIAFRGKDAKPFDYQAPTPYEVGRTLYAGLIGLPPYILLANQTLAAVVELQTPKDTGSTTPNYNAFPDYQFLVLAGTKGQTSLSRQEFDRWARTYAQSLANQAYAMRMYQKAVQRFNKAKTQKAKLAAQNEGQQWTQSYQMYTAQLNVIPLAIHQALGLKQ
jgi:hypothetical protein